MRLVPSKTTVDLQTLQPEGELVLEGDQYLLSSGRVGDSIFFGTMAFWENDENVGPAAILQIDRGSLQLIGSTPIPDKGSPSMAITNGESVFFGMTEGYILKVTSP